MARGRAAGNHDGKGQRVVPPRRQETMMPTTRLVRAILLFCIAAAAADAHAQTYRGVIRGRVEDPSGAVIAGAPIMVTNQDTNDIRKVVTSDRGAYAVAELPPGVWNIEISVQGHKTHVQ